VIRHPYWLALEALSAIAIAALGHFATPRAPPEEPALHFGLSVLGEREQPDGSWQGADVLANPSSGVNRFQLSVRPEEAAQLTIDAVGEDGIERLFPSPGQSGLMRAGQSYGLPSPKSFYELAGQVRLRITVRPPGTADANLPPAATLPESRMRPYPLSDGAHFLASERTFVAPHGGKVELSLEGHQGIVTPTPSTSE